MEPLLLVWAPLVFPSSPAIVGGAGSGAVVVVAVAVAVVAVVAVVAAVVAVVAVLDATRLLLLLVWLPLVCCFWFGCPL